MIGKSELTGMLRDASDLEEGITKFLTDYLRLYFDWSIFPEDRVFEVKKMLDKMRSDSDMHFKMVEDLISWISQRKENEF